MNRELNTKQSKLQETAPRFLKKERPLVIVAALAAAVLAALPAASLAQSGADYPTRIVKIVVPFAPGGTTDAMARLSAQSLSKRFNQSFIVENRPGGNTLIGTDVVAKSSADGYTLGVQATSIVTEQVLNKDWQLRVERDLSIVSIFAGAGYAVSVSNETGVKNLKELVAYVKANASKVNHGQAGSISPEIAMLKYRLGLPPIEDVMYKGGPLAVQALAANEVQIYAASTIDVAPLAKAGKLRIIAYTEKVRDPLIPEVLTVAESGVGLNDYDAGYWFTMFAPANLPGDVTSKLNAGMVAMTKEQEFVSKAASFGMHVYPLTVAESRTRVLETIKALEQAQAAGIKLR